MIGGLSVPTDIAALVDHTTKETLTETYNHHVWNQRRWNTGAMLCSLMMVLGSSVYIQEFQPDRMRNGCIVDLTQGQVLHGMKDGNGTVTVNASDTDVNTCIQNQTDSLHRGQIVWGSLLGLGIVGFLSTGFYAGRQKKKLEQAYPFLKTLKPE